MGTYLHVRHKVLRRFPLSMVTSATRQLICHAAHQYPGIQPRLTRIRKHLIVELKYRLRVFGTHLLAMERIRFYQLAHSMVTTFDSTLIREAVQVSRVLQAMMIIATPEV